MFCPAVGAGQRTMTMPCRGRVVVIAVRNRNGRGPAARPWPRKSDPRAVDRGRPRATGFRRQIRNDRSSWHARTELDRCDRVPARSNLSHLPDGERPIDDRDGAGAIGHVIVRATKIDTVPAPLPVSPEVTRIQAASLVANHAQSAGAFTSKLCAPPSFPSTVLSGESS